MLVLDINTVQMCGDLEAELASEIEKDSNIVPERLRI